MFLSIISSVFCQIACTTTCGRLKEKNMSSLFLCFVGKNVFQEIDQVVLFVLIEVVSFLFVFDVVGSYESANSLQSIFELRAHLLDLSVVIVMIPVQLATDLFRIESNSDRSSKKCEHYHTLYPYKSRGNP